MNKQISQNSTVERQTVQLGCKRRNEDTFHISEIKKISNKSYSLLAIREMYITATMERYSMSLSTAQMEERGHVELWQRCGATGSLVHCQGERKMIQPH